MTVFQLPDLVQNGKAYAGFARKTYKNVPGNFQGTFTKDSNSIEIQGDVTSSIEPGLTFTFGSQELRVGSVVYDSNQSKSIITVDDPVGWTWYDLYPRSIQLVAFLPSVTTLQFNDGNDLVEGMTCTEGGKLIEMRNYPSNLVLINDPLTLVSVGDTVTFTIPWVSNSNKYFRLQDVDGISVGDEAYYGSGIYVVSVFGPPYNIVVLSDDLPFVNGDILSFWNGSRSDDKIIVSGEPTTSKTKTVLKKHTTLQLSSNSSTPEEGSSFSDNELTLEALTVIYASETSTNYLVLSNDPPLPDSTFPLSSSTYEFSMQTSLEYVDFKREFQMSYYILKDSSYASFGRGGVFNVPNNDGYTEGIHVRENNTDRVLESMRWNPYGETDPTDSSLLILKPLLGSDTNVNNGYYQDSQYSVNYNYGAINIFDNVNSFYENFQFGILYESHQNITFISPSSYIYMDRENLNRDLTVGVYTSSQDIGDEEICIVDTFGGDPSQYSFDVTWTSDSEVMLDNLTVESEISVDLLSCPLLTYNSSSAPSLGIDVILFSQPEIVLSSDYHFIDVNFTDEEVKTHMLEKIVSIKGCQGETVSVSSETVDFVITTEDSTKGHFVVMVPYAHEVPNENKILTKVFNDLDIVRGSINYNPITRSGDAPKYDFGPINTGMAIGGAALVAIAGGVVAHHRLSQKN